MLQSIGQLGFNCMRRILVVFTFILLNINSAFAVDIPEVMKQTMSHETGMPSLLHLLVSMILVIGLIYLTGWIYAKLNIVNRDKLNKISFKNDDDFKFNVLQSMPLGQQRYLYTIEMKGKVMLIGSTSSHINLLKEFDSGDIVSNSSNLNKNEPFDEVQNKNSDYENQTQKSINIDDLYRKYKS